MAISQKDIKLLWGRSGNRCAICRTELTQDKKLTKGSYTLGEQAHIVGEKEDAARGYSTLSPDERNSYHNLILLCPTHHTEIDKNEDEWPVEKLYCMKSKHEIWVQETLAEIADNNKVANELICAEIIDITVDSCRLREWHNWTSFALSVDPNWPKDFPHEIYKYRQKVIATAWPEGFDELRNSVITLSILLLEASNTFLEHCEEHDGILYPIKFYKGNGLHNPNYDEDHKKYEEWLEKCDTTIKESTKAANWFADVVRRDINPLFFASEGKFLIETGPDMNFKFTTTLLEFTDEEKSKLPDSLIK